MIYIGLAVAAAVAVALAILFGSRNRFISQLIRNSAPNIVPLFYLSSWTFFLYLFEKHLVASLQSSFSLAHVLWIRFSYSLVFTSFVRLYLSDPGRVTRLNWESSYDLFPFDRILYLQNAECRTCQFSKPARSKHCSVCNCCVSMQDHHCVFVNNCIGLLNFRWFALFLAVNLYVFMYGWCLLFYILLPNLKSAWNDPNKWFVIALLGSDYVQRIAVCLWFLSTILSALVIVFAVFHLSYVWAGVTANEADKWQDIKDLIPVGMLYYAPGTDILLFKRTDGTWNRQLSREEEDGVKKIGSQLQLVESDAELPNIYDRGFYENLKLLLIG